MESPLLIEFKGSDRQSSLFLNMQQQGTRAVTEHNYEEKQSERQSGESDTATSGCAKIHVAVVNVLPSYTPFDRAAGTDKGHTA